MNGSRIEGRSADENQKLLVDIMSYKKWRRKMPLGRGIFTSGPLHPEEWSDMYLPSDLRGSSFLDIGSNDGFFSFQAERLGAEYVVALDRYDDVLRSGHLTKWDYKGIKMFKEFSGSQVNIVSSSFEEFETGIKFDHVLLSNVLVWMENVDLTISKLASVTNGTLYIRDGFYFGPEKSGVRNSEGIRRLSIHDVEKKLIKNGFDIVLRKRNFHSKSTMRDFLTLDLISSNQAVEYYDHPWSKNPLGKIEIPPQFALNYIDGRFFVKNVGWIDRSPMIKVYSNSPFYRVWKQLRHSIIPFRIQDNLFYKSNNMQSWVIHCRKK
jgi:SAM-dependent methyltransferase